MDWETLKATCLQCTMCPLCQTRHNVVFGVGPTDAEILFVGEGPGEQEDLTGEPFVGPAGKLLDDMLRIIDLGRHNCISQTLLSAARRTTGTRSVPSRTRASVIFAGRRSF